MMMTPAAMPETGISAAKSMSSSSPGASAQLLDFSSERTVFGGHIAFNVRQTAIDVLEPQADVARGPCGGLADGPPEIPLVDVRALEFARLVGGDHAGNEIDRQDRSAAEEDSRDHPDPDQGHVEPGVVGDPGADSHDLAVALVAIEAGAARGLVSHDHSPVRTRLRVLLRLRLRTSLSSSSMRAVASGRHCWRQFGFSAVMMRSIEQRRSSRRLARSNSSSRSFSSAPVIVADCFHLVT